MSTHSTPQEGSLPTVLVQHPSTSKGREPSMATSEHENSFAVEVKSTAGNNSFLQQQIPNGSTVSTLHQSPQPQQPPRRVSLPGSAGKSPSRSVRHSNGEASEILLQRLRTALDGVRQLQATQASAMPGSSSAAEGVSAHQHIYPTIAATHISSIEQQLMAALEVLDDASFSSSNAPVVGLQEVSPSAGMMLPRGVSTDAFGASQINDNDNTTSGSTAFHTMGGGGSGLSYMQTSFTSGAPAFRHSSGISAGVAPLGDLPNVRDNLAGSHSTMTPSALSPKGSMNNFNVGPLGAGVAYVANAAIAVSRIQKNRVTSITYEHVPDGNVAEWLTETFAPSQRRRRSLGSSLAANAQSQHRSLSPALSFGADRGSSSEPPPSLPASVVVDALVPITATTTQSSNGSVGEGSTRRDPLSAETHTGVDEHQINATVVAGHSAVVAPGSDNSLSSQSTPGRFSPAAAASTELPSSAPVAPAANSGGSAIAARAVSPHSSSGMTSTNVEPATLVRFARNSDRVVPAVASTMDTALILKKCGNCPMINDVDSEDFDIFRVVEEKGVDNTFLTVATNIFSRYSFMTTLAIDCTKFVAFLKCICQCYRKENLYHNAIHATDCLQTVHIFLCVNDMRENFSDIELLSVLFAAIVHDLGHLGVNNAFLNRLGHPISQLFSGNSTLESAHAASALFIVSLPQYCFFPIPFRVPITDSQAAAVANAGGAVSDESVSTTSAMSMFISSEPSMTPEMLDDFRSLVVECLLATDMKHHAEQIRIVKGMLDNGAIGDGDFTNVLRSIIHVADISNPMKMYSTYVKWMSRVVAEFWVQGDAEKKRGFPISMMCDKRNTFVAKGQHGFIQFVVRPFALEMAPIMPSVWWTRLEENAQKMLNMPPEEEQRILQGIHELIGDSEWTDDMRTNPPRLADGTPTRLVDIFQRLLSQGGWSGDSREMVDNRCVTAIAAASDHHHTPNSINEHATAPPVKHAMPPKPPPPSEGKHALSPHTKKTRAIGTSPIPGVEDGGQQQTTPPLTQTLPPIKGTLAIRPYGSASPTRTIASALTMPPSPPPSQQQHHPLPYPPAKVSSTHRAYDSSTIGGQESSTSQTTASAVAGGGGGGLFRPPYRQLRDVVPTPQWMATLITSPRK